MSSSVLSLFGVTGTSSTLSLFGVTSSGSKSSATSLIAEYNNIESHTTASVSSYLKLHPSVLSSVQYFEKEIGTITSVDQLFSNKKLYSFITTALGITTWSSDTNLVKKALLDKTSGSKNLANELSDSQLESAQSVLQLNTSGLSTIQTSSMISTLITDFEQQSYYQGLESEYPGLTAALEFRSEVSTMDLTSSDAIYTLMGNGTLKGVLTTALNLPTEIVYQSTDTQAKEIKSKLNLHTLSNKKSLDQFIERYLVAYAQNANGGASSNSGAKTALSLLNGSSSSVNLLSIIA
ncbi:MAG: DUF1217 domain-containing protein [Azospirillaceae bacterium]|nr:DUF1217 domain-containing protein [Azospirillaceae bacterium]